MKIYICNEYGGYNTFDEKIPPMLEKLRKILGEKIFESTMPLRIYRGCWGTDIPYSYEIFKKNDSLILVEIRYWSSNEPYNIVLDIRNPKEELVESIQNLMREYPVYSEKKSEWEHFVNYESCPICGCSIKKDGIGFFLREWKDGECPNCGWRFKSARTIPYIKKES